MAQAQRVEDRTRSASRWFSSYLVIAGCVAFAWIVALEAFFPSGSARSYASGAGALTVVLLFWWRDSHDVLPRGAGRRITVAVAFWFLTYLLLVGPFVRWQAGTSVWWWSLAAAVSASPFFVGAWLERRRS